MKDKKSRKKNKILFTVIRGIIIVALSVLFASIIIFGAKDILGIDFNASDVESDVYIDKGASTADIAKTLHQNGIIDQPILFRVYCKLGKHSGFQYGYHSLSENMSYAQVVTELQKLAKKNDVVEITVKEGWNFYDICKELKSKGVISDITAFTKAVERMEVEYKFVKDVPDNSYRHFKYEGYFYPDKYEFYTGTDDYEGIAKKFFANFVNHIDNEIVQAVNKSKYSFDEIITIASLIQSEAGNVNEMGTVSSVFHNRLDDKANYPYLQSDVTINYVENAIKPSLGNPDPSLYQDLYDAYNTYKRVGLMPGAVCNPTKEAIRAAIFPENTTYYFFVTDYYGKYYYSRTFAQHQKNCQTAQKRNEVYKRENG